MKTTEMETIYDLGVKMIEAIQKEKVQCRPRFLSPATLRMLWFTYAPAGSTMLLPRMLYYLAAGLDSAVTLATLDLLPVSASACMEGAGI